MQIFSMFQVIPSSEDLWVVKCKTTILTLPTLSHQMAHVVRVGNIFHRNGTRSSTYLVTYFFFFFLRANLREIFLKFWFSPFLVPPQLKGSGFTTSAKRVGPLNPFYHCIRISPLIASPVVNQRAFAGCRLRVCNLLVGYPPSIRSN
jgi:hypothetical protein